MAKRKRVAAALHSELTEYSSLVRALRTTDALDVTFHISEDVEHDLDDEDAGVIPSSPSESRDASPKSPDTSSRNHTPQSRSSSPIHESTKRDTWTRWPLLIDDVYKPEWSPEDEMGHLVEAILKRHPRPPLPAVIQPEDDDQDNISSFVPHLTNFTSNHLSSIFALLAAHTPNRPHSQQNRIEPMGWRAVLDILSSSANPDVADPKIIDSVKARLEALYGRSNEEEPNEESTPPVLAAHRIQCSKTAKEKLKAQLSQPMESLLNFPMPPPPSTPPRRSRKRGTKNQRLKRK